MSLFQYRSFSKKNILVLKEKSSVAEQGAAQKQQFCSEAPFSSEVQLSSEAKQFRSKTVQERNSLQKCHTLILDLKILLQNSFLFLVLFNSLRFTLQFSTVLQLRIFTISVFNLLACKTILSVFLALQVI